MPCPRRSSFSWSGSTPVTKAADSINSNQRQSETACNGSNGHHIKYKAVPSAGEVMLAVFFDVQNPILIEFLKSGITINSIVY